MSIGYKEMNNEMGRYFRTLPKNVQESIMQSGVVFHTKQDMHRCAQFLMHEPTQSNTHF